MGLIVVAVVVTLVAVFLRRTRWSSPALVASRVVYALFMAVALLYFPAKAGFQLTPLNCEWTFGRALAAHSLTNYPHIILFALFFPLTYAQLPNVRNAFAWSAAACLFMGLFVELAQGTTGVGHCRMRDLIPDSVGTLAGALFVLAVRKLRRPRGAAEADVVP